MQVVLAANASAGPIKHAAFAMSHVPDSGHHAPSCWPATSQLDVLAMTQTTIRCSFYAERFFGGWSWTQIDVAKLGNLLDFGLGHAGLKVRDKVFLAVLSEDHSIQHE